MFGRSDGLPLSAAAWMAAERTVAGIRSRRRMAAAAQGWHPWWEERPHLVAVGIGLDAVVFLTVWLVTLGFARLDLTMFGAKTTAGWFWLWIAGAGMGLTGAIIAASPERRSFGLGILLGLPLPVLLACFLTA